MTSIRGDGSEAVRSEPLAVRELRPADVETVVAIEAEAFTSPWRADTFLGLLGRDTVRMLVMTDAAEAIVGYAVLWIVLDQGELANLAVVSDRRGEGLGRALLDHVLDDARGRGVEKLFLEVRESNEVALRLYRAAGFEEIGRRPAYYDNPREDARVLAVALSA